MFKIDLVLISEVHHSSNYGDNVTLCLHHSKNKISKLPKWYPVNEANRILYLVQQGGLYYDPQLSKFFIETEVKDTVMK